VDYYSLDLQITKESESLPYLYRASILENGEVKTSRSFELRRDLKLTQMLNKIEQKAVLPYPQTKETVHIEFGKILYETVFSGKLGNYFNIRLNEAQDEDCGLRVSLQISEDIPEIITLPWEYLHNGEEFLVTGRNILLSRLPLGVKKTEFKPLDSILRMLVIISGPDDPSVSPLNTEKEQEIILEAINKLHKEQRIKVDFTEDATFENIQYYLTEQNYHIVHFTGHGICIEGKGNLVFETEDRKVNLIDNKTLANLFSDKGIRLVVLNSCESAKGSNKEAYSDIASELLRQGVPAVVAMQYSVLDDVAIQFALNFYKAITNEESVDCALEEARKIIHKSEQSNGLEFATPVLYLSDYNCVRVGEIKEEHAEFGNKSMMLADMQVMKTGFVARNRELRNLERDFRTDLKRVAVIHGLGGMGKTVLAIRFAQRVSEHFDGVFGMKCTSTTTPEEILSNVNIFLKKGGFNEFVHLLDKQVSIEDKTSLLVDILNQKHFLIIFDNFDVCLDEEQKNVKDIEFKKFIQYLLKNTLRSTKFIITTRYDFDITEGKLTESIEHISLPELHFPQANWLMNNYKELANISIQKKKQIYRVIGGYPWAVGQFAKLASSQGVNSLLLDLEPLKKEIIEFTRLHNSFLRLDGFSRKLFLCASIYDESVPIEALSSVIRDNNEPNPSILESLQKLLKLGLISKELELDQSVYTEYTIVRDFARNKLEEEGFDKKELLTRAAGFFESLAFKTEIMWYYLIARKYYFQAEDWESANGIVEVVIGYLISWGYIELAKNLLNESISATSGNARINAEYAIALLHRHYGDLDTAIKLYTDLKYKYEERKDYKHISKILHELGVINQGMGNYQESLKLYNQSLEIYEKLKDKIGTAEVLNSYGVICYLQGNYEEAVKKYNQSLEIQEELGEKSGIAQTLHQLGLVYQDQGNYEEAVKKYNQSLKIEEELGEKSVIAVTLHNLGCIHHYQGNYEEAVENYNQSLKIKEELGDRRGIAQTLHQLGTVYYHKNNYEEAFIVYNQSLKIKEELGDRRGIATTLHQLGLTLYRQGNYEEAVEKHNQSLKIKEEMRDRRGIAQTLHSLGIIHQVQGDYEEAFKKYNQSLRIEEELGGKSGIAIALHSLGNIYHIQSDYEKAVEKYKQSLKIAEELGDRCTMAGVLYQLGTIDEKKEEYHSALGNYLISLTIFLQLNLPDTGAVANSLLRLRNLMGEEEFDSEAERIVRYNDN